MELKREKNNLSEKEHLTMTISLESYFLNTITVRKLGNMYYLYIISLQKINNFVFHEVRHVVLSSEKKLYICVVINCYTF